MAVSIPAEEFCTNCGDWFPEDKFNFDTGWCIECSPVADVPLCSQCGTVLKDLRRTTCHRCRQEQWLERHSDELEFLIVAKGYSLTQARITIVKLVRPICQHCHKPIKGGTPGESLFCKSNKSCHSMYGKYRRLVAKGLTKHEALAIIHDSGGRATKGR